MSEQILISRADGICEVRFNRPEKRNAITFAMYEALYRGLREAQADAAVRVVLLGGEGAGFCAGNDLNDFLSGPPFSAEHPVMGFLHTLATFEKPLLAAVHGQTVGIGVTLLLHCDLVVAARSCRCRSSPWAWCRKRPARCCCRGWWVSSARPSCCCSASPSMPPPRTVSGW